MIVNNCSSYFFFFSVAVDNDYEDLSGGGNTAKAIYDYQGGTYNHNSN